MSAEFTQKLTTILEDLKHKALSKEERAVMSVIYQAWLKGGKKVTQRDIAKSERWLGCNKKHELDIVKDPKETTLRKVRQIVRDLRVTHRAPILSDRKGYWIPLTFSEVNQYLVRIEGEAKAQAAAWFETYRAMQKTFEVESKFFEQQASLFTKTLFDK